MTIEKEDPLGHLRNALGNTVSMREVREALATMPLRLNLAVLMAAAIDMQTRSKALVILAEILLEQTAPETAVEPTL